MAREAHTQPMWPTARCLYNLPWAILSLISSESSFLDPSPVSRPRIPTDKPPARPHRTASSSARRQEQRNQSPNAAPREGQASCPCRSAGGGARGCSAHALGQSPRRRPQKRRARARVAPKPNDLRRPPPCTPYFQGVLLRFGLNPRSSRVGTARYLDVSWTGEPFLSFFFPGVGLHQDEAYVLDQRNALG